MSESQIFNPANMFLTLFAKIKFSQKLPDLQYFDKKYIVLLHDITSSCKSVMEHVVIYLFMKYICAFRDLLLTISLARDLSLKWINQECEVLMIYPLTTDVEYF